MYSSTFAHYYDQLMGDYSTITNTTKQLVTAYLPPKSHLLELGCGTGNMLQALSDEYELSGLDNATTMLEIAKKKVPSATFYHEDMTTFHHKKRYEGVLCIFDTINHLPSFSQWKRVFTKAHSHLKPGGIFIFDMNTVKRLDRLSQIDPYAGKVNEETLTCVKFTKIKENNYTIKFQLFEDIQKEKVRYTEETVHESAFATDKVIDALSKHYTIEKMVDPIRKRITVNTGRIFFVCKKK